MFNRKLHRNSQKRFYGRNKIYFITTITFQRHPYFKEEILCRLLRDILLINQKYKKFDLYGWVIIYEHVHLLIKPRGEYNISQIMKSIKENFSRDINKIILRKNIYGSEASTSRLHITLNNFFEYYKNFNIKYREKKYHRPFKWQSSFRDHVIRNEKDFADHLEYIWYNPIKHKIIKSGENYKWRWVCKKNNLW